MGSTTASPGMLQMTEAEKSTTANWSGAIADAFFTDSTMTSLKSGAEISSAWSSLTPEQQAQVEQDCSTMQTASTGTAPTTGSGATTGTSGDTTASTSGTAGTTGTAGTSSETTASASDRHHDRQRPRARPLQQRRDRARRSPTR